MNLQSWSWAHDTGPARLRAELARDGYAWLRDVDGLVQAEASPWLFAHRLLGMTPVLVEKQPIRAVAGGRSFAATAGPTPLHTDSQRHEGRAPAVQIMVCVRPAEQGGTSLLVDGWALLDRIAFCDPALLRALFEQPRRIPFVFGAVYGPTVGLRRGVLTFHHSPMPLPHDPVAVALQPHLECSPIVELPIRAGEVLVVDNHRMLHGRTGFADRGRQFTRLLVWTDAPLGHNVQYHTLAAEAAQRLSVRLAGAPAEIRGRFGLDRNDSDPIAERRLRAVLRLLAGVPPGLIAGSEEIAESDLYEWRDAALAAAARALSGAASTEAGARHWYELLR